MKLRNGQAVLSVDQPHHLVNSVIKLPWDRLETLTSAVELCSLLVGSYLLLIAQSTVQEVTQSSLWEPSREQLVEPHSEFLALSTIHHTTQTLLPTTFHSFKLQATLPQLVLLPQLSSDPALSVVVLTLLLLDGVKLPTLDQQPPTCNSWPSKLWPTLTVAQDSVPPMPHVCSTTPFAPSLALAKGKFQNFVFR